MEQASRHIVSWTRGTRGATAARRLWQQLPLRYRRHCWHFTDEWKVTQVLPPTRHRRCPKGDGSTNVVEAINYTLRHRCGILVRKSCSFSKCLKMHTARLKIIIDCHNRNIISA